MVLSAAQIAIACTANQNQAFALLTLRCVENAFLLSLWLGHFPLLFQRHLQPHPFLPFPCCSAAELDIYKANCMLLRELVGAQIPPPETVTFNSITADKYPAVVLQPSWAPIASEVKVRC